MPIATIVVVILASKSHVQVSGKQRATSQHGHLMNALSSSLCAAPGKQDHYKIRVGDVVTATTTYTLGYGGRQIHMNVSSNR